MISLCTAYFVKTSGVLGPHVYYINVTILLSCLRSLEQHLLIGPDWQKIGSLTSFTSLAIRMSSSHNWSRLFVSSSLMPQNLIKRPLRKKNTITKRTIVMKELYKKVERGTRLASLQCQRKCHDLFYLYFHSWQKSSVKGIHWTQKINSTFKRLEKNAEAVL